MMRSVRRSLLVIICLVSVPERGPHLDALAYRFPVVARDSTVLRIHWGEVMIPMRVRVSRQP